MSLPEGSHVAYIGSGEPDAPLSYGDQGSIIMEAGPSGSHVQWNTGECKEHISLISNKKLHLLEASQLMPEESYTEDPIIALATCPTCFGEGLVAPDLEG